MPRIRATLTVEGINPKTVPVCASPFLVGRSRTCHLSLQGDAVISRQHTEIRFEHGRFLARNLNSFSGTRVNGRTIMERTLEDGDRLEIGGFVLRVSLQVEDAAERRTPPASAAATDPSAAARPASLPTPSRAARAPEPASHAPATPGPEEAPPRRLATPRPPPTSPPAPRATPPSRGGAAAATVPLVVTVPAPGEGATNTVAPPGPPAPPLGEGPTHLVDMSAVLGVEAGEAVPAVVSLSDVTGITVRGGRRRFPRLGLFAAATAGLLAAGLFLHRSAGSAGKTPELSFDQVLEFVRRGQGADALPPGAPLPRVTVMQEITLGVGRMTVRPLLFPAARWGVTHPEVLEVRPQGSTGPGFPTGIELLGAGPGAAALLLLEEAGEVPTRRWDVIVVRVVEERPWPRGWTDRLRREVAARLVAEADRIERADPRRLADADVGERARALARYAQAARLLENTAAPPPKLLREAQERAGEIGRRIGALEQELVTQYRGLRAARDGLEMRRLLECVIGLFPLEGEDRSGAVRPADGPPDPDELLRRHGDRDRHAAYQAERLRLEGRLQPANARHPDVRPEH